MTQFTNELFVIIYWGRRYNSTVTDCLQDEAGDTPLYDAIAGEKNNMVDMLLNNPGLALTLTNQRGFNYLQFAVLKGNKQ